MPLKLNVGLSRKIGLPNYGSLGASCHIELELEQMLMFCEPDALYAKIKNAYLVCRQAVHDELARHSQDEPGLRDQPHSAANGKPVEGQHNGNDSSVRLATARQIRAIEIMALRQRLDLLELIQNRFDKEHLTDLSRAEASRLIDDLESARTITADPGPEDSEAPRNG